MENESWVKTNIPGANQLVEWFGYWPSFHDAEVIELHLARAGTSWLKIHIWNTTKEVDADNAFVTDKDVVVTFKIRDIQDLELTEFSHQNVIFGLVLKPAQAGIELELEPCFGLSGRLLAKHIELDFTPGKPTVE